MWTAREIAEFVGIGGMGAIVVGSPKSIADQLQSWIAETDLDGFNLAYAVTPESFSDFVELIVPELQRRGVFKREYQPGTLREKLYGPGRARLSQNHPAAIYRRNAETRTQGARSPVGPESISRASPWTTQWITSRTTRSIRRWRPLQ